MSEHTPGPWVIDPDSPLDIATYDFNMAIGCAFQHGEVDCEESCANARLMAAAPEMLEMLKTTSGNIRSLGPAGALGPVPEPYKIWLANLEEIIAKAEGESP